MAACSSPAARSSRAPRRPPTPCARRVRLGRAALAGQLGRDGVQETLVLVTLLGIYPVTVQGSASYVQDEALSSVHSDRGYSPRTCGPRLLQPRPFLTHLDGLEAGKFSCGWDAFGHSKSQRLELIVVWFRAGRYGGARWTCRTHRLAYNRAVLFVERSQLDLLSLAFAILYPLPEWNGEVLLLVYLGARLDLVLSTTFTLYLQNGIYMKWSREDSNP